MSPGEELQRVLFATLTADTVLMAKVDGVYDRVPVDAFGARQAYISFGPYDASEDDADCIIADDHTQQIDIWSRAVGAVSAKDICARVKALLHEQELPFVDNALVELRVFSVRVIDDPDPLTVHGVVTVTASIEEDDE